MHPDRSLSRPTDRAVHDVITALFVLLVLIAGYNVLVAVCRIILALGWYVS
ncbi:hypothetical protein [Rhodococcus sp. 114MFTsu3.1]|uniref:hypothetical protein n=1 Tax=Rhodococcus sp. 114MFTsu3.1 TaxID=1172184 RepID=UPI0003673879|nr:hypothetical protein [Rhodococcus sp. 114MFTsu3.1]